MVDDKSDVAVAVHNWICKYWGMGSYNPRSDFHNCEALLNILHQIDEQSRNEGNRPWQFLNEAYEQVQLMREIALGRIEKAI